MYWKTRYWWTICCISPTIFWCCSAICWWVCLLFCTVWTLWRANSHCALTVMVLDNVASVIITSIIIDLAIKGPLDMMYVFTGQGYSIHCEQLANFRASKKSREGKESWRGFAGLKYLIPLANFGLLKPIVMDVFPLFFIHLCQVHLRGWGRGDLGLGVTRIAFEPALILPICQESHPGFISRVCPFATQEQWKLPAPTREL